MPGVLLDVHAHIAAVQPALQAVPALRTGHPHTHADAQSRAQAVPRVALHGILDALGQAMGGGSPAKLAHGISIALYNTAFGLIVAIPTLIFWRYFRSRVDAYLLTLELASEQFVRHILRLRKK